MSPPPCSDFERAATHLINDALRRLNMSARPKRIQSFRTKSLALGRVRLASIDNVGEDLALSEG
jgi:hypothetical protein